MVRIHKNPRIFYNFLSTFFTFNLQANKTDSEGRTGRNLKYVTEYSEEKPRDLEKHLMNRKCEVERE